MDPVKIYEYLMQVRERLFDAAREMSAEQWGREFTVGLKSIGATLTHLMISEWYYIERIEGRVVPAYEDWAVKYEAPHTPSLAEVERMWREQEKRVLGVVENEKNWKRKVSWVSFPDDTRGNKRFEIRTTAGDIFTQLVLHEMHHRAQVMMMMRDIGPPVKPVEDVDFNALMYERVEVGTGHSVSDH